MTKKGFPPALLTHEHSRGATNGKGRDDCQCDGEGSYPERLFLQEENEPASGQVEQKGHD